MKIKRAKIIGVQKGDILERTSTGTRYLVTRIVGDVLSLRLIADPARDGTPRNQGNAREMVRTRAQLTEANNWTVASQSVEPGTE